MPILFRATTLVLLLFAVNFADSIFAQMMPYTGQPHAGVNPAAQWVGFPGEPVVGYYQPVKINAPNGTRIAFAVNNRFVEREDSPYLVGLLLGANYRLRITDIKFHAGKEIFPSVTILQRTYPPKGSELDYPIQIDLTHEDLELALNGKFVTRVIYLENPQNALPVNNNNGQITTEAKPNEDPLRIAYNLGKPVAIIQLGGRIPTNNNVIDPFFFHGSPPLMIFNKVQKKYTEAGMGGRLRP
ncbi:MAG: hypothetical protein LBH59_05395 [Planctomycetaceae bacterium]|jgi:hypothetical protein|nr:hypothetical protein [Planctomycetaceae bacterium]